MNLEVDSQLHNQFDDNESIDIVNTAVKKMTGYYEKLEDYNLFHLELAVSRLKTSMLFNQSNELKQSYIELLKTIIIYIARASDVLSNVETIHEEQKELLKQIAYGVSVITEKVNNKFLIKKDLPEELFNVISTLF